MERDTEPGALGDYGKHRRKLLQFSPDVNMGHILQIVVLAIGGVSIYGTFQAERALQKQELEQVKKDQAADVARQQEATKELKMDVRSMQSTLIELNINVTRMSEQLKSKEHTR